MDMPDSSKGRTVTTGYHAPGEGVAPEAGDEPDVNNNNSSQAARQTAVTQERQLERRTELFHEAEREDRVVAEKAEKAAGLGTAHDTDSRVRSDRQLREGSLHISDPDGRPDLLKAAAAETAPIFDGDRSKDKRSTKIAGSRKKSRAASMTIAAATILERVQKSTGTAVSVMEYGIESNDTAETVVDYLWKGMPVMAVICLIIAVVTAVTYKNKPETRVQAKEQPSGDECNSSRAAALRPARPITQGAGDDGGLTSAKSTTTAHRTINGLPTEGRMRSRTNTLTNGFAIKLLFFCVVHTGLRAGQEQLHHREEVATGEERETRLTAATSESLDTRIHEDGSGLLSGIEMVRHKDLSDGCQICRLRHLRSKMGFSEVTNPTCQADREVNLALMALSRGEGLLGSVAASARWIRDSSGTLINA